MTSPRSRARRRRRRKSPLGRVALTLVAAGTFGAVAVGGSYFATVVKDTPGVKDVAAVKLGQNTRIYDRNSAQLAIMPAERNRTEVTWAQIPANLRNATVAIEDKRFYKHGGVDWGRVLAVAVRNLASGTTAQGGSTITMQLAKNLYYDNSALTNRTATQKVREIVLATRLEAAYSKREILTRYLNAISYGGNAVGVEAAALTYFRKNVWELTLPQSALLAGLPQAPSTYNPFRRGAAARERRNEVLNQMLKQGYITQREATSAKLAGLQLRKGNAYTTQRQPYFVDYVRGLLRDKFGERKAAEGGFRVETTIDQRMQRWAKESIDKILNFSDAPEAAIVLIDARTGYIRAMQSKTRYGSSSQYNFAADARRQPGSTFKVFGLTQAVSEGINPNTTFYQSKRLNFDDPVYGKIDVETYSRTYRGVISLFQATLASDNSVYTQLGLDVTPEKIASLAERMGIGRPLKPYASLVLGGQEVTPLEMAVAYAPLANGGFRVVPTAIRRIVGAGVNGNPFTRGRRRVFSDGVAYEVTRVLAANIRGGTGTKAYIGIPSAGKTGTTDDFIDAWFVGYTPRYVAAVWVGYPNNSGVKRTLRGVPGGGQGGNVPARIWGDFMRKVTANQRDLDFPAPKDPVSWEPFASRFTRAAAAARSTSVASAASAAAAASTSTSTSTPDPTAGGGPLGAPDPAGTTPGTNPASAPAPDPLPTSPATTAIPPPPAPAPPQEPVAPPPPPP